MTLSPGPANCDLVGSILHIRDVHGQLPAVQRYPGGIAGPAEKLNHLTEAPQQVVGGALLARGLIAGPPQ